MSSTNSHSSPSFSFQPSQCSSDLVAMAAQRQAKIERYRQQKRLESQLSEVRKAVDRGQADEEVMRSFYLLNIQRWITVCLEEIESIAQELEILRNMDGLKRGGGAKQKPQNRPPMKPFILTKDAMQVGVCVEDSVLLGEIRNKVPKLNPQVCGMVREFFCSRLTSSDVI